MRSTSWFAVALGCALGLIVAQVQAIAGTTGQGLTGGGNCASSSAGCKAASFSTSGGANIGGVVDAGQFVSAAASGINGFACVTNGCRVDLGDGTLDYLYSDGATVWSAGNFRAASLTSSPGGYIDANGTTYVANLSAGLPLLINDAEGLRFTPTVLATCTSAIQGTLNVDIYTGDAGVRTKLCFCTNAGVDGGGTAAWQNVITGAIGTTTTCGANP